MIQQNDWQPDINLMAGRCPDLAPTLAGHGLGGRQHWQMRLHELLPD